MRCHRWATVAVNNQLFGLHILLLNRCFDQLLGQARALTIRQHPADNTPTVDVKNDVKIVIRPCFRSFELGDVPRPDFIGACREQFGLFVAGVLQLVSPFARALIIGKDSIHRSYAAKVFAFIEQLGVNLTR